MKSIHAVIAGVLFLSSAASASSSESYDPTTLTAAQIFKNANSAGGKLADGAYISTTLVHSGGIDWTYITTRRGNNSKTTYSGAAFTGAFGYYNGQSWKQDLNGVVTIRSNFHFKEDPNALAFQHPDDPKSNVRVLGVTQTEPRQYVVEINPPDGVDEYRYYDVKTSLLTQAVAYTRDRYRHVTEYSDYRNTYGEMLAYHIHSYDGRSNNDSVTTLQSFTATNVGADLSIPNGSTLFSYTGSTPIQLPAHFTPYGIILRAVVNGRGLDFILDSGASGLLIDPGIAHELGVVASGRTTETIGGGDVDMGHVRIPKMTIGSLEMDNVVFSTTPFNQQTGDARAVGLMGFDFIASGIFGIDFKKQTLTLYPRTAFDPNALGLRDLPLQLDDGVPRTDVWIEGVHGHFVVDTGAFQMLVYHDFAQKLPARNSDGHSAIGTVGGSMATNILGLSDIVFGGVKFNQGQAIEPNQSTFDLTDYDGLIGRDVLQDYQAYFDYADGALYVKPNL